MKKFICLLLATLMLVSACPISFAAEPDVQTFVEPGAEVTAETAVTEEEKVETEYDVFTFPVVNEVRDITELRGKNSAEEEGGISMFSLRASVSTEADMMAIELPAQTAQKNSYVSFNAYEGLDEEAVANAQSIIGSCLSNAVVRFVDGANTYVTVVRKNDLMSKATGKGEIPVPADLADGVYSVVCGFVGYNGESLKLTTTLTVSGTAADSTVNITLPKCVALNGEALHGVEGTWTFEEIYYTPADESMFIHNYGFDGVAFNEKGDSYRISASYEKGFGVMFNGYYLRQLPVGEYKCYAYGNLDGQLTVLGPITVYVDTIGFNTSVICTGNNPDTWMYTYLSKSVGVLPENADDMKLKITFKDSNKNEFCTVAGIALEEWWSDESYNEFSFRFNFVAFDAGKYYADMTLCDGAKEYPLGEAAFTLVDNPVLRWIGVTTGGNYNSALSPSTKNFSVELEFNSAFGDVDKIDLFLVDANGNVVAKTTDKGIYDLYSSWTELIYDLEVIKPLDTGKDYSIQVVADKSLGLVNTGTKSVYITTQPLIKKTEFEGKAVTIHTENLAPGTYFVQDTDLVDVYYTVVIDEYGVGSFTVEDFDFDDYWKEFCLSDSMTGDYIFRIWFSVERDEENHFTCTPDFFSTATTNIENFYFEILAPSNLGASKDIPKMINYAYIMQNDVIVADITNLIGLDWYDYGNGTYYACLEGDILTRVGSKFTEGSATVVVGYNTGFVGRGNVDVLDANSGIYGQLLVDNWHEYGSVWVSDLYVDYLIPTKYVDFTLFKTNITSGTVSLRCNGKPVETYDLSELSFNSEYGYMFTYSGRFKTEIAEECYYEIIVESGENTKRSAYFAYSGEKRFSNFYGSEVLTPTDTEMYVWCHQPLNISDLDNVRFVANVGGVEIELTKTKKPYVSGAGNVRYYLDVTSIPGGYFTVTPYDGTEKISYNYSYVHYKVPANNTKPFIFGTTNTDVDGVRVRAASGVRLDKGTVTAKLFKRTELLVRDVYVYYDDISTVTKSDSGGRLVHLNKDEFLAIRPGAYKVVWYLDGVAAVSNNFTVAGEEMFDVSVVLNGGNSYVTTNKVTADITYRGYTKMRYAFSEEALATTAYGAIASTKEITLPEVGGTHYIFFQFASADERDVSKVIRASVTLDDHAPVVTFLTSPRLNLWSNGLFAFASDEPVRSAYLIVGESDGAKVEGRQYVFNFEGLAQEGYIYELDFYADSSYKGIDNPMWQTIAIDHAGNVTRSDIFRLALRQPRDITGVLRDEKGNAVANTSVVLRDPDAYNREGISRITITDADGVYEFTSVTPGDYALTVEKKNYRNAFAEITPDDFNNALIIKDLVIESRFAETVEFPVHVMFDGGAAVSGAKVTVTSPELGISLTQSTSAGVARFTLPANVQYMVTVSYEGYTQIQGVLADTYGFGGKFYLPERVVVSGTVKSGDGFVKGEKIAVSAISSIISPESFMAYATTDDNGKFELPVYITNGCREFVAEIMFTDDYVGGTVISIPEGATTANAVINAVGNIAFSGTILDKATHMATTAFTNLYFSGNGIYEQISVDQRTGEFKTPAIFGVGTYRIYGYASRYENLDVTVTVTADDLATPIKSVDVFADKLYEAAEFTSGANGIASSADVITAGERVNVSFKFQNDGTETLENVVAYTILPEGVTAFKNSAGVEITNHGVQQRLSLAVPSLALDETRSFSFVIDTSMVTGSMISIPAYVIANGITYTIGAAIIEVVNVTLDAPDIAKSGETFKVSGTAPEGSLVEILNADTNEVLASTLVTGKWYFTEIKNQTETVNLVAKVILVDKVAYSKLSTVVVESDPISIEDCVIRHNNMDMYKSNEYFGYPTFSSTVDNSLAGSVIKIAAKFANMPAGATVTYNFLNKTVKAILSNDGTYVGYYEGNLMGWRGSGTKKITATVTVGEKVYEFTLAEVVILIDPSGYITDEETGAPIVGAKVTIEYWDDSIGCWQVWDASASKQLNPMYTDSTGYYGWVVPEGRYRLIIEKDGYETLLVEEYYSVDAGGVTQITVPPARTDVNVSLISNRPIALDNIKAISGGRLALEFSRAINPTSFNSSAIKVTGGGSTVSGTFQLTENNTVVVFTPNAAMSTGEYSVSVSNIYDMQNREITNEIKTVTVDAFAEALAAPAVEIGENSRITVTFTEAPVNPEEIKVYDTKNNEVNGMLTVSKDGLTVVFAPEIAFDATERYFIVVPATLHDNSGKYLASAITRTVGGDLGDVNGDDAIDIVDAVSILNYFLDPAKTAGSFNKSLADINRDGMIDIVDAVSALLMYLRG